MVGFVLVGVGGEVDQGLREGVTPAQVGADGDGIAGSGVAESQGPAAHLGVGRAGSGHGFDLAEIFQSHSCRT